MGNGRRGDQQPLGRLFVPALWRWGVNRFGRPPVWTTLDVNPHYAPHFGTLATATPYIQGETINRSELAYLSGMPITLSIGNTGAGSGARTIHVREVTMRVLEYVPLAQHAAEHDTLVALQTVQAGGRGSEYDVSVRLSVTETMSLPLLDRARRANPKAPTYLTIPPDVFLEVTLQITAQHAGRYLIAFDLAVQWGNRRASVKAREQMWILESPNVAWINHAVFVYEPTGEVHEDSIQAAQAIWEEWRRFKEPVSLGDVEGRKARVRIAGGDLL